MPVTSLEHYAEPFSATGSLASEGVRRQLGTPKKDPVEVLIREALQNCWDAKREDADLVDVSIQLVDLTEESGLSGLMDESVPESRAADIIGARRALIISDRGTSGLGGVLRSNVKSDGVPRDFVDFIRNIGQPPDTEFGGGTYGFGKVALFGASRFQTIVAYTACNHGGEPQKRLMLARLGEQYEAGEHLYTGRHWWGQISADGVVDPLLDEDADVAAERLGLPLFRPGELGTSIAIVEPDFGRLSDQEALGLIAECVAWNFWPKLVEVDGSSPMAVEVLHGEESIPIPSSKTDRTLQAFTRAYELLKKDPETESVFARVLDIECGNPRRHLGKLALLKVPSFDPAPPVERHATRPFSPVHHTCLLRAPELVVDYSLGPESVNPTVDYVGVFLAARDLDRVFAEAEPPTHDEWVPDGLADKHHQTFVRVAHRRIREAMKEFIQPLPAEAEADEGTSLAEVSDLLSALVPNPRGPSEEDDNDRGGRDRTGGGGGNERSPRAHLRFDSPRLVVRDGRRCMEVPMRVDAEEESDVVVVAEPRVLLDSGAAERDAPAMAEMPEMIGWRVRDVDHDPGDSVTVAGPFPATVVATVSVPEGTRVEFGASAKVLSDHEGD